MADLKNPFMEMFQKFGEQMQIPSPDLTQMMNHHQKNLQALQEAAKIGTDSAMVVMEKQRAALGQTLDDIAESVRVASAETDATQMMSAPMDLAKRSFDATIANATEIGEIVKQGNMEAMEVLRDRMMKSVEEMTQGLKKS